MKKETVIQKLEEMFKGCGNGVMICNMNSIGDENFKWRICRSPEYGRKVNWVKCKKILDKEGIKWREGESGWGWRMSRGIDFEYNG